MHRTTTTRRTLAIALLVAAATAYSGSNAPAATPGGRLVLLHESTANTRALGDDIPAAQRRAVQRSVDAYVRRQSARDGAGLVETRSAVPATYPFFPMAGQLGRDLFQRNFLDLDPAPNAIRDFNCTAYTYDGHLGHDITIRGFAEQDIGVPVYAALDGVVVRTDDGHFDENGGGTPVSPLANHVVIDHGNQQIAYYWHLKNGSVEVLAGDQVVAGQQIGLTASSGWSSWPHLHFETHVNGVAVEPSSGGCNPGASGWQKQPAVTSAPHLADFAFSHVGLSPEREGNLPWDMTRTGQMALADPITYFWFQVRSLPANAAWRAVFRRPDGTTAHDETGAFATAFNRGTWFMFGFDVTDMHRLTGTWELEFFLAGQSMGVMPLEVVERRKRSFNRPPEAIKVGFSPRRPQAGQVLTCLVTADLLVDDLDYDVVSFEYTWTVNGEVVRHLRSAAHSDVLRRDVLRPGDKVICSVTPRDGRSEGPTARRVRKAR